MLGNTAVEECEREISIEESSSEGLILFTMKLLGRTAGIARQSAAKTADKMIATSGEAKGKMRDISSKIGSFAFRSSKKKEAKTRCKEIENLQQRLTELYFKIGARVCELANEDSKAFSNDSKLEAISLFGLGIYTKRQRYNYIQLYGALILLSSIWAFVLRTKGTEKCIAVLIVSVIVSAVFVLPTPYSKMI